MIDLTTVVVVIGGVIGTGLMSIILYMLKDMKGDLSRLDAKLDVHEEKSVETVHKPITELQTQQEGTGRRLNRLEKKAGINGEH